MNCRPTVSDANPPARHSGFTLIELMITVAVVGILTAIALPNYSAYAERSRRADGKAALLAAAQWLERSSTMSGVYPANNTFPPGLQVSDGKNYDIGYAVGSNGSTYLLTAQPRITDSHCGKLMLDQAGTRSISGTVSTVDDCWMR
jgi:type IV pilus assembly protein PilE